MLTNLALGLSTMAVCLFCEALLLIVVLRYYAWRESVVRTPGFWSTGWVVGVVMIILVLGNLLQVGIWSVLFVLLGEFAEFDAAFYHSAVNFATLGYGDLVMSEDHRLLGPLEAINGVLMIGVSTAALMAAFQDAFNKTVTARREAGVEGGRSPSGGGAGSGRGPC